jgi:hypothetical protein
MLHVSPQFTSLARMDGDAAANNCTIPEHGGRYLAVDESPGGGDAGLFPGPDNELMSVLAHSSSPRLSLFGPGGHRLPFPSTFHADTFCVS